jgi:hypothetical protein
VQPFVDIAALHLEDEVGAVAEPGLRREDRVASCLRVVGV